VICKQLAHLFHGEISVDSIEGVGSTFTFTARLTVVEEDTYSEAQASSSDALSGCKVLLLTKLLSCKGADVERHLVNAGCNNFVGARTDSQALEIIKRQHEPFDFIFINCNSSMEVNMSLVLLKNNISFNEEPPKIVVLTTSIERSRIYLEPIMSHITCIVKPLSFLKIIKSITQRCSTPIPNNSIMVKPLVSVTNSVHILVVEDNIVNQKVIDSYLKKRSVHVSVANNGLEALNIVKSSTDNYFSIIFMDLFMPEMDGLKSTAEIRKWEQENHKEKRYPIIALTANVMQEITEQCRTAGMDGYLSKPINFSKLDEIVKQFCM